MVKLPEVNDPTLVAVDKAMEDGQRASNGNTGIAMGNLGNECNRSIWYDFRWVSYETFDAQSLKRFEDGYTCEDQQAKRLRMVDGITLITKDPATGKQVKVLGLNGHATGKLDGEIIGLLQAPKTPHVWEHKAAEKTPKNKLEKLKSTKGEKQALKEWNMGYYIQAQLYMHYRNIDRHYMTVSLPGGRDTVSVRTEYDDFFAAQQEARMKRIAFSSTTPDKIADDPDAFGCKFCSHKDFCHKTPGAKAARRNCRTCVHVTPREDGTWHCDKHNEQLDYKAQMIACNDHRYIPDLVHGEQIDAAEDGSWVSYLLPDGSTWIDGEVNDG